MRCRGGVDGDAVALERVHRNVHAQLARLHGTFPAAGQHKLVGRDAAVRRVQCGDAAALHRMAVDLGTELQVRTALCQQVGQLFAELAAVGRAFAGGVDGAGHARGIAGQCRLQARHFGGIHHLLQRACQRGLQGHLLRRAVQRLLRGVEHQLARLVVVAVQGLARQHGFEGQAAFGGQGQQGPGAVGRGPGVAGTQELQAPGPLPGVGLQAEFERRVWLQQ